MAVSKLELLGSSNRLGRQHDGFLSADSHGDLSLPMTISTDEEHERLHRLSTEYRHIGTRFDPDNQALWCFQRHLERPCFSEGLLSDVGALQQTLKHLLSGKTADRMPFSYLIWASSLQGIYNLGGDLAHFCKLVRRQDADGLRDYAKRCVEICYLNAVSLELPILTVALVQGDALGGGFESVLSNDLIIAEEGTKFGLPEVVFNLFPGMGAYSFLSRRLDASRAKKMIMSGRLYTAEDMYEMGIVDRICPKGEGEREMRLFMEQNARRKAMLTAMANVGRRCQPIAYEELIDVADLWVDTTLGLGDEDLRRMERLVSAQDRRLRRTAKYPLSDVV